MGHMDNGIMGRNHSRSSGGLDQSEVLPMTNDQLDKLIGSISDLASNKELLIRLDERSEHMSKTLDSIQDWQETHEDLDTKRFNHIFRVVYMGVGAMLAVEIAINIFM